MNALPLRWRAAWLGVGWLAIAAVIWLSLIPDPPATPDFPYGDKLNHLLAYGFLMGWFGQLYRRPLMRLGYAFSFVFLGVVLEITQGLGGYRWFEVADAVANMVGVVLAFVALRFGADRLLHRLERCISGPAASRPEPDESP
ncbi:MAG: hypothetical protein Kow006_17600 [Gammaproteobacteria bacterium]